MKRTHRPKAPGKRADRVPQIMQLEPLECGAACLAMIAAYYGKWIPLEQIRGDCGVSRDGSNALNIVKAARKYGFDAHGYRYEPETLRDEATFPCIVHWEFNHFLVVRGFRGSRVYVNNPAIGEYSMSWDDFNKGFTGVCLCFTPTEAFQPGGKPTSIGSFVFSHLKSSHNTLVFLALATAILAIFGIAYPMLSQIFVDKVLSGQQPDWLNPILIIMLMICILQGATFLMYAASLTKLQAKIEVVSTSTFMWKILHLPMKFFSERSIADLNQRALSNQFVARQLIGTIAPLLIDFLMLILYGIIMFAYSWLLAAIGIISVVVNLTVARLIAGKRANVTRVQMRDQVNLDNATIESIDAIESLKASGAERLAFQRWSGYQASVNTQYTGFAKTEEYLSLIPKIVTALANIFVLVIGLYLVMDGQFSVGMILAFQGLLANFMAPTRKLAGSVHSFQEIRTLTERIQDVVEHENDPLANTSLASGEGHQKLRGKVSLKGISFGYSPLDAPIIENFSLDVPAGSSVAIVGTSGSGKSTLAKLIMGLYAPWEGTIRFDDKLRKDIPKAVLCGSVAVVDQDIVLFNDTISENIRLWDNSIEDFEVILAARDARIHDTIMQKEGGYDHVLYEGGSNFSGGQRQRIEIARALAGDPTILILDEATNLLDAETEKEVMDAIRKRGITCIVIAHRLSAIRDCDEIIVLDKGNLIEHGTHETLLAADGLYTRLVSSE